HNLRLEGKSHRKNQRRIDKAVFGLSSDQPAESGFGRKWIRGSEMKKLLWLGLGPIVLASAVSTTAQNPPSPQTIVLYSPIQYDHDFERASVDLERGAYASRFKFGDVGYGLLRVGNDVDWLEVSIAQDRRTAII